MAELLLNAKPAHKYDADDVVYIAEDGHIWSQAEQNTNVFKIVTGVSLSQLDLDLLRMPDEQAQIPKSALKVPSLRSKLAKRESLQLTKRRRYGFDTQTNSLMRK